MKHSMHPALDAKCQENGRLEEISNSAGGLETMTDIRSLNKTLYFNATLIAGMMILVKVSREDNHYLFICSYI